MHAMSLLEKWLQGNAVAKVCDLVNVDRVVTDREPRPEIRRAMRRPMWS